MIGIGFAEFVWIRNKTQDQTTPRLHLQIARWLAARWQAGERELLLLAFRSSGKSTLVGLFCAWLLSQNPDLRILVLAGDFALAKKMVRNVKRVIERHPLTGNLKPAHTDHWASDQFTVKRRAELRDPSMLAKGIGANITGLRADVVICDDVEVPNTCDTAAEARRLAGPPARTGVRRRSRRVAGLRRNAAHLLLDLRRSSHGRRSARRRPRWPAFAAWRSRCSMRKAAAAGRNGSRPNGSRPFAAEPGRPNSTAR